MHPLLRKTLLRIALYIAYVMLFAWIFTFIEKRDDSPHNIMERMLSGLRMDMNLKYNITDYEFESFVRRAATAVETGNELDWTFLNSMGFLFAALTTVGKA